MAFVPGDVGRRYAMTALTPTDKALARWRHHWDQVAADVAATCRHIAADPAVPQWKRRGARRAARDYERLGGR